MNSGDDQIIDSTYSGSYGAVRFEPSDADIDYVNGGYGKVFMTILPGIIVSSALIIGSFRVEDYSLFIAFLLLGCFILSGSIMSVPMIKDLEEKRRIKEVKMYYGSEYYYYHQLPPSW